jgi:hypothetical protein
LCALEWLVAVVGFAVRGLRANEQVLSSVSLVAVGFAVVIAVVVGLAAWRRRTAAVPAFVRRGLRDAKQARRTFAVKAREYHRRVQAATARLAELESARGRRLKHPLGGVTLYERWIDTPHGGVPLFGVRASAADHTAVLQSQRLTATRMVTLGVFRLRHRRRRRLHLAVPT